MNAPLRLIHEVIERVLPHNVEAEQSVLGSLLIENSALSDITDLSADDFYLGQHRDIFGAIRSLIGAGKDADPIEVVDYLKRDGLDDAAGGLSYLTRLESSVPNAAHVRRYADIVIEHSQRRRIIAECQQREASAYDLTKPLIGDVTRDLFAEVNLDDLADEPEDTEPGAWGDRVPAGVVTLLGAHGGAGKSYLGLMLAVCVALGLPLFGVPTRQGVVAFYSAEDSAKIVRKRLRRICRIMAVDPRALAGRLHAIDAAAGDPVLFQEVTAGGNRVGATTPVYGALRALLDRVGAGLLIVDNASDAFDGNEIARARVRAFMRSLNALAQPDRSLLLLAHVDKGTARGERNGVEGYSGSTAWHNSARSRLFLSRDKDGTLLLEHQKSNLGALCEPLRLRWAKDGIPELDTPFGPLVQGIADRGDTRALLRLIHEFTERGEFVTTATTSRTHAGKLLRGQPAFPHRLKDGDVFDLLRDAERAGHLQRAAHKGTDRKDREHWTVTAAGRRAAGIAATAATAATADVTALAQCPQERAATAATSLPGGTGGKCAHTEPAAIVALAVRTGGAD